MTSVPQVSAGLARRPGAATRRSSLELAVSPLSARTARHWAAALLAQADPRRDADLIDTVMLLVSELVTNAIHAVSEVPGTCRPRVRLAIVWSADVVRIEVHDSARSPVPSTCRRDDDDESGRGLAVISALASDWGWAPEPPGKVVWCEVLVNRPVTGAGC
jgi:anti-sigma regulatory factor (Ser/Thr protein kinase)